MHCEVDGNILFRNKKIAGCWPATFYFGFSGFFGDLPQRRLEVRVRCSDLTDVEVLHQEVEDIRGDIGRQSRAYLDVLYSQGEEG
jgi:hypothetical protein